MKKRLFNQYFSYTNTLVNIDRITFRSFVISFCLGTILFGSSIQIRTESGKPLSQVYITHLKSNKWIQTDEFGIATISFISGKKDTIRFQRFGYKSLKIPFEKVYPIVVLIEDPIKLSTVFKSSKRNFSVPSVIQQTSIEKNSLLGGIDNRKLLNTLPGINLKTFGGPGSIATVSINGGPTHQTLIKLGDFELTNIQTGVVDISQLPSPLLQSARLVNAGFQTEGTGSQNGTLYLEPWEENNEFAISIGSFGHSAKHIKLHFINWNTGTSIILGRKKDDGNFPVINTGNYPVVWEKSERLNNSFNQDFIAIRSHGFWNKRTYYKIFNLYSIQNREVPGLIWSPSKAIHNDKLFLLGTLVGLHSKYGNSQLQYILRINNENYFDPTYLQQSHHKANTHTLVLEQNIKLLTNLKTTFKGEVAFQELISSVYNKTIIKHAGNMVINWEPHSHISIKTSLRQDYSNKLFNKTTYGFSGFYKTNLGPLKQVGFIHSTHFRYPSFNDLYWVPGGNSDLLPETGTQQSANFLFHFLKLGRMQFHIFTSRMEQMIQWFPLLTYWQPQNIQSAIRKGMTINVSYGNELVNSQISFSSIHSFSEIDQKLLRYSPENIWTWSLNIDWKNWTIFSQMHFTDEMISVYSYPTDVIILANKTISLSVGKSYLFGNFELIPVLAVNNLEDIHYESSKGYPEPGRTIRCTLTIKPKMKE